MSKQSIITLIFLCFLKVSQGQNYALNFSVLKPRFSWEDKVGRVRLANYKQFGLDLSINRKIKKSYFGLGYRLLRQNLTETVDLPNPPTWAIYKYKYSRDLHSITASINTSVIKYKKFEINYGAGLAASKSYKTHFIGETILGQYRDTFFSTKEYNVVKSVFQQVGLNYNVNESFSIGIVYLIEFKFSTFKDLGKYYFIQPDSRIMTGLKFSVIYNFIK